MGVSDIVVMTDHGSGKAVGPCWRPPSRLSPGRGPCRSTAGTLWTGGNGRATVERGTLRLNVPGEGLVVTPEVVRL